MAEVVYIKGLAEQTHLRLRQLPEKLQKTLVRGALGSGAQVVKRAAMGTAPVRSGRLRASAIVKFLRNQSNAIQAAYVVTFRRGKKAQRIGKKGLNRDAFYASWVEFGHKIVPRARHIGRDRRGRLINSRTVRARRGIAQGFVEGKRFLTRAFNESGQRALNVIVDKIRSGFDAAVR